MALKIGVSEKNVYRPSLGLIPEWYGIIFDVLTQFEFSNSKCILLNKWVFV